MERRITTVREFRTVGRSRGSLALAVVLIAASAAACRTSSRRPYLWVENFGQPPERDQAEYRIAPGDVLSVRVWNQESISTGRSKVRVDGKISVPFLQDVDVAGTTPADLARRLEVELRPYVVTPVVTVTLEERAPIRVSVIGEVARPGAYEFPAGAGVLQALAAAGGLTPYAPRDGIYVLRDSHGADGNPGPVRLRFRYRALSGGVVPAATFHLKRDDVIVVE